MTVSKSYKLGLNEAAINEYPKWVLPAKSAFDDDFLSFHGGLNHPELLLGPANSAVLVGRRIRPALFYSLWKAHVGTYPSGAAKLPAIAVEYFHAASIIVDDIADGELQRRNKPALYRQHGNEVASLCAHYLTSVGYSALASEGLPSNLVKQWNQRFAEICAGQSFDYLCGKNFNASLQQRQSLKKTSSFFGFVGDSLDALLFLDDHAELLELIGEAFQIGNDVVGMIHFEESKRHSETETYVLRLSYLLPVLIDLGIVKDNELFKRLSHSRLCEISSSARRAWSSAKPVVEYRFKQIEKQIENLSVSQTAKSMAIEFVTVCSNVGFWHHEHS